MEILLICMWETHRRTFTEHILLIYKHAPPGTISYSLKSPPLTVLKREGNDELSQTDELF